MRASITPLISFLLLIPFIPSVLGVFKDDAYQTDWHLALLGPSLPSSTFFHPPTPDSKASLIYSLTTRSVIAAINPKDGDIVWRHALPVERPGSREHGDSHGAVAGGVGVIAVAAGPKVVVYEAHSGKMVWERDFVFPTLDVAMTADGRVVVLLENGEVKMLGAKDGEAEWEKRAYGKKSTDVPVAVWMSGDDVTVATLQPSKKINYITLGGVENNAMAARVELGTAAAVVHRSDISKSDMVMSWRENSGQTLKISPLSRVIMVTSITLPSDVLDVDVVSKGNIVVVQFKAADKSWADVYQLDDKFALNKIYTLDPKERAAESTFSVSINDAGAYVIWTLPTGETTLYSAFSSSVLAKYTADQPLNAGVLSTAISEVVPRPDGTSYAVRTFLSTAVSGFIGDTHLIRNGDLAWTRRESLSSTITHTWVELLDPATEEILEELDAETHTNVVAAYAHRVKRHIQELFTYGPAWAEALPHRIYGAFLNIETEERTGKWRDFFGFRKFAIIVTAEGGLAAIDVSRKGEIAWKTSLVYKDKAFEGIASISEIRKGVVGIVESNGQYTEYDAFEGVETLREGLNHAVQNTAIVDTPEGKAIVALLEGGEAVVLPRTTILTKPVYLIVRDLKAGIVQGMRVSPSLDLAVTWTFKAPEMEEITSLTTRPSHDPVASIGRVLGDRSVMYKYLNDHLLLIATANERLSTASIYVLDSVSGVILHSGVHSGVDTTQPLVATLAENWLVYSYFGDDDVLNTEAAKGYHLVVSEFYESEIKNDRGPLGSAANISSFAWAGASKPYVYSQSYIFPAPITTFSVTSTKQGITAHEVIASVPQGLYSIPKRILDPRRPIDRDPTPAEQEEGLFRYAPIVEIDPRQIITHELDVLGLDHISTTPSQLESTSLVFSYGLDLFSTRVSPSMAFDILGKGFGKIQLVLTVVALAVGAGFVAPMVRRKQINARWMV